VGGKKRKKPEDLVGQSFQKTDEGKGENRIIYPKERNVSHPRRRGESTSARSVGVQVKGRMGERGSMHISPKIQRKRREEAHA